MKDKNGFEAESDDTRIRIKVPTDEQGNNKKYSLTIEIDGEKYTRPVDTDSLKKLFKDWQMGVPGVVVHEPWGGLEFTDEISPREAAIVSNAMNAYVKAGRLNLEWKEDHAMPGEPGYSEDKEYIEPDYEGEGDE